RAANLGEPRAALLRRCRNCREAIRRPESTCGSPLRPRRYGDRLRQAIGHCEPTAATTVLRSAYGERYDKRRPAGELAFLERRSRTILHECNPGCPNAKSKEWGPRNAK